MRSFLLLSMVCAALWPAAADGQAKARARDAESYTLKDAHDGVTLAAEIYDASQQSEKIKAAFGKYDPRERSILPVYIMITNTTRDALKLDVAEFTFERLLGGGGMRQKLRQISGEDVSHRIRGIAAPKGIKPGKVKPPISEIIDQEFLVKMIPPGDSVGGFLYFEAFSGTVQNWSLLLNGVRWASSGKELFFFEIKPLEVKP